MSENEQPINEPEVDETEEAEEAEQTTDISVTFAASIKCDADDFRSALVQFLNDLACVETYDEVDISED